MTENAKRPGLLRSLKSSLKDIHDRHAERRSPTGFGFAVADRISFLDASRWDAVVAGQSFFMDRDVLRNLEVNGPDNIEQRYAMIFRDDKPVAAVAAQLVDVNGNQLRKKPNMDSGPKPAQLLKKVLVPARKLTSGQLNERLLVAGNLLSWGFHGIAFAPGEDPTEIWPGIAEALYRIRRAERLAGQTDFVMVKDCTDAHTGQDSLKRFSYRSLETEPNMVLELKPGWKTYEDYLAALDAKYRRNAKDQAKKLAAAGCTVEPLTDLETNASRLHELYLSVQSNAQVRLVTLPETYLPGVARAAGDRFKCTVLRREGQIIGFVTSLKDGDTAIGYYIGFDREAASGGLPIYLRLLHATIDDAIQWRCKRLSLGRTALEPKAALGAKPETMRVWMRHRVPALNWVIRGLLGAVPHAEAPERNPFKAVKEEAGNGTE